MKKILTAAVIIGLIAVPKATSANSSLGADDKQATTRSKPADRPANHRPARSVTGRVTNPKLLRYLSCNT